MKIERIDLPKENTEPFELYPVRMDKLQNIVLLAGKNGSGKSRFFSLLKTTCEGILSKSDYGVALTTIKQTKSDIQTLKNAIKTIDVSHIPDIDERGTERDRQESQYQKSIKSLNIRLEKNEKKLKEVHLMSFSPYKENDKVIDFVPKKLDLKDSYKLTGEDIDKKSEGIYRLGTSNLSESVLPAIQKIQNEWANIQIEEVKTSLGKETVDEINENYKKLKEYISIFLNAELQRDRHGHATIFGKKLGEAKFSDGQKILLQFCLALYGQESNLSELVIMMDEPENHLHPAALIEVLDKIVTHIPKGQLWIATHSINILAHFDPSYIWYIEKGEISYAGNLPQKVLEGLLGEEEEIERLSSFLSLPAKMASDKFAFESLFYPKVVMTDKDDHQTTQIFEIISERAKASNPLKVLDFGMGQGRLIAAIYENSRLKEIELSSWLDYYGFDAFDTYKTQCEERLNTVYGDKKRYFNKPKEALTDLQEGSLDFIVMCNVLHEIDPNEWLNLFNSHDSLMKLLKPDGFLMIVEDQFLAIGEKAHSKGFTVLDSLELKRLFSATEETKIISKDYRRDGRLKAHMIPASLMVNVTSETRIAALKTLSESAKSEIRTLRTSSPSFKNGKLHSFWAQQLANATLSLEQLSS